MSRPLITVLMAVYNGERFLKSTIESVLGQTYKDFEFLIVDDCSRDNTVNIIKSFADERINLHRNEKNMGQTASLNAGLKRARGVYIARIDADDIALPEWLKKQLSYFEQNPKYAVVSTSAAIIDEANKIRKILKSPSDNREIVLRSLMRSPINHVGSLIRKDVLAEGGGYDENFKIAADYQFWSGLIERRCPITSSGEVLMMIREHKGSLSVVEIEGANFSETSRIIQKNVSVMTEKIINDDEARLACKAVYHGASLSWDDFLKGTQILENVFLNLKPAFGIGHRVAGTYLRKLLLTIHVKRIFSAIKDKNVPEVRRTSLSYVKKFGLANTSFVFYLCSFFGKSAIGLFPSIYEKAIQALARLKIRKEVFPPEIQVQL